MKSLLTTSLFLFFIYLNSYSQVQEIVFPVKHASSLTCLTYSSDKKYIATSSEDRTVKLWYASNSLLLKTFTGHKGTVTCVDFSSDTKMLVSGSADSSLIVWNINNGKRIIDPVFLGGKITSVCFNPNNQSVISGTDAGKIVELNISSGKIVNEITYTNCKVTKLSFSKDNTRFLVSITRQPGKEQVNFPGSLLLFDLKYFNKPFPISTYKEDVSSFCKSPDSSKIISSANNGMVRVWDAESFTEEISFKNNNLVPGIVFMSRSGKMIGVAGQNDNNINIWRISGEKLFDFTIDQGKAIYAEFNEDITRIHICNDFGKFLIYDLNARERDKIGEYLNTNSQVTAFSASPQSNKLVIGYKNGMLIGFDLQTSLPFKISSPQNTKTLSVAFSYDGKKIFVSNDQTVYFVENSSETKVGDAYLSFMDATTGLKTKFISLKNEYSTSLISSEKYLIAGFNNGLFKFYDYASGKEVSVSQGHDYDILDIQISSDQKLLISGSMDASLKIWKIENSKLVPGQTFNFNSDVTHARYCSLNNNILVSTKDNGLKLIRNLKPENIENIPVNSEVTGMDISEKDSVFFVSFKSGTTECSAFSSVSGKQLWNFTKAGSKIINIKYSAIYNTLACCLENGSIIILNANTGKEILTIMIFDNDEWLAYTPDNMFDGSLKTILNINIIENLNFTDRSQIDKYHQVGLIKSVLVKK